jgi:HEXXH motif-containing protein
MTVTASTGVAGEGLVLAPRGSRALTTAFSRYLVHCHERFESIPEAVSPRLRESARRVAARMRAFVARDAKNALFVYASPTIGTPLQTLSLRDALGDFTARIDTAIDAVPAHVLFELCARDRLDDEAIEWPATPTLASLALGIALDPPDGADSLSFERGRITARAHGREVGTIALATRAVAGFRVRTPYARVRDVTRYATIDHNPVAAFEAHPDKRGNHVDLGDRLASDWLASLDESLALIEAHLPELYAEMRWLLHEIVPVGFDREKHLSASYREAIGTVYLTLHPNVMTMTEALVHEFQHNKLNLAAYSADFLVNAYEPRYPSPVRPDPRPLWGILLAVHAFLPVAVLYRRMRDAGAPRTTHADFTRRLAEIDLKNHEGMEMLRAHAQWTPQGRALFADLDALDRAHMAERAAAGETVAPTDAHVG